MTVHELHRDPTTPPAVAACACPPWCVLDPGHVAAELACGSGVVHRGAESVVTCRTADRAVPATVEVRICRQRSVGFDDGLGTWVPEPQPTVHVSGLPEFSLRPDDALALAVALAANGGSGGR